MRPFEYVNIATFAELSSSGNYKKLFRLVSFGGAAPKYDIRTWNVIGEAEKPLKGVTLDREELRKLREALNKLDLDAEEEPTE